MFVDVMGKLQKWVSLAELRIDTARSDLNNLRQDFVSRSSELAAKDRVIAEMRKKLTACESTHKIGAAAPNASAMSFVPSRQPLPGGAAEPQPLADEHSMLADPSVTSARSAHLPPTVAASRAQLSAVEGKSAGSSDHLEGAERSEQFGRSERSEQFGESERSEKFGAAERSEKFGRSAQGAMSPSQLRLAGEPTTADAAVQSGKGKDRKRESELESELARLRKENEAIAKERADYENAIQRALLRGVSSLNAETLKVLRCPPPVSGCAPCGRSSSPANATTAAVCRKAENAEDTKTSTTCFTPKNRDDSRVTVCRKTQHFSSSRGGGKNRSDDSREGHEKRGCCRPKRPNTTMHQSCPRYRKPSGSNSQSMVFILQQAADTPVACNAPCNASQNRSWNPTKSKKVEVSCPRKSG